VYERARERLVEELGADPSAELAALHLDILRDEPITRPSRANLRAELTSVVGRDAELGQVAELLAAHRLVTLTGPGGAGKTRLAVEAVRTELDTTPDEVWLVGLAPVTDPAEVTSAVLAALGLCEQALVYARRPALDARTTRSPGCWPPWPASWRCRCSTTASSWWRSPPRWPTASWLPALGCASWPPAGNGSPHRRGVVRRRPATALRLDQNGHSGAPRPPQTRAPFRMQIGGSARGYQAIFVPSTVLASPGYDGQPAVYLYIAALEANVLNCRRQA